LKQWIRDANFPAIKVSPSENQKIMGYISIQGKFGASWFENSFLIPHITKEYALKMAVEFYQRAIIWAKKHEDKNGNPYFEFEYLQTDKPGNPDHKGLTDDYYLFQKRFVSLTDEAIQARKNFYSRTKQGSSEDITDKYKKLTKPEKPIPNKKTHKFSGKWFTPFFQDDKQFRPGSRYGTVDTINAPEVDLPLSLGKAVGESFYIPFFDDVINNDFPVVEIEGTVLDEDIPMHFPEIQRLLEDIKLRESVVYGKQWPKEKWAARGMINCDITTINELAKRYKGA
jgi:hypothetical protein